MPKRSNKVLKHDQREASPSGLDWPHTHEITLTANSDLNPDHPEAFMDRLVSSSEIETVQRCMTTLYEGLMLANRFDVHGGYTGKKDYKNIFLVDNKHILGVCDTCRTSSYSSEIEDLKDRIIASPTEYKRLEQDGMKALVALEKASGRLVNGYEKGRQSNFMVEVIYPALIGILRWANTDSKGQNIPEQNIQSFLQNRQANKHYSQINSRFLQYLFRDPRQIDTVLYNHSPLWFIYNELSPLNIQLDIEGDSISIYNREKIISFSKEQSVEYIQKHLESFITGQYKSMSSLLTCRTDSKERSGASVDPGIKQDIVQNNQQSVLDISDYYRPRE